MNLTKAKYISAFLLGTGVLISGAFALSTPPTEANNLYGAGCGPDLVCGQNQTCQKTYRGVLPITSPNSTLGDLIGGVVSDITGSDEAGDLAGQAIDGGFTGGEEIEPVYACIDAPVIDAPDSRYQGPQTGDGYNTSVPNLDDPGVPVNIINQGPVPVDLFNPLPVPTNIVSPNPLPVVVVDDLAMYQQKELIDGPLAEQQKAQTIGTVSDNVRNNISQQNLTPENYDDVRKLGIDFGVLDPETGVVAKDALETYQSYQSFDLSILDEIRQEFEDLKEFENTFDRPDYNDFCEGEVTEASQISMECTMLALMSQNNLNDIEISIRSEAERRAQQAAAQLDQELRDGDGFFSKTDNNERNPFTKIIQSPGSNIDELVNKVIGATFDQAIVASDKCYASVPTNILEGTLDPVLKEGLFGDYTEENPLSSIGDTLLENLASSINCELNNTLSGLFNDWVIE